MATWYTDNITGNDITGDGSIALPYKTIQKAITIAADDDTVNVAGSGYTSVAGTLTFALGSSAVSTSRDMTADLPAGTIFSVNDPMWGARKTFYKVRSITSTVITLASSAFEVAVPVSGIEKVTTNTYATVNTTQNLEDLSALNKTGIKLEGGWTNNFTAQDGVTWFVFTGNAVGISGTALKGSVGTMLGLSINNFGFGAVTGQSAYTNGTGIPCVYGNIYIASGGMQYNNNSIAHTNGCNFYANTSVGFTTIAASNNSTLTPLVINNFYNGGSRLIGGTSSSTYMYATINNLWTKTQSPLSTSFAPYLVRVNMRILNWYPTYISDNSLDLVSGFTNYGNIILNNIEKIGNIAGPGKRAIVLKDFNDATIQIIAPTENVDAWGIQTKANLANGTEYHGWSPILDIEGEKQFYGSGSIVFADPTVYETGTNSFRVNRSEFTGSDTTPWIPVKGFYIADATAKTISIRYKSSSDFSVKWTLLNNGTLNTPSGSTPINEQTTAVTSAWTTVTYTISADTAAKLQNSYILLGITASQQWSSPYVWIDSVTIA